MLGDAIGGLLPAAVGVALSPVPIIAVILILGTPKARSNGPAFALGWIAGLTAVSAFVIVVVGNSASDPDSGPSHAASIAKLLLGVLLLALAGKYWRGRPKPGEPAELPAWMASVDSFTPIKSLGLGVLLSAVNPKNLALTLAASATIAQAGLPAGEATIADVVFVVLGSVTVVGPVLAYLVAERKVEKPLASIKAFMGAHNNVIMMVVLLILGAKLVGDGISGLAS